MAIATTRYHGLDALRGIAMLLGVVLHSALPYMDLPKEIWPTDNRYSPVISVVFEFIHIWRMPVFFILAGFFASLIIERYSWRYWWKNRLRRILLPLIIFSPLVTATLPWIWKYGQTGEVVFFYTLEGVFPGWHLWFLWHLMLFLLFTSLFIYIGAILKKIRLSFIVKCFSYLNLFSAVSKSRIFQSKFPIALIIVFTFFNLGTGADLILNPIASGLYFAFGYGLYKSSSLFEFMKSHWKQYLIASTVFFILFLLVNSQGEETISEEDVWGILYVTLKVINAVLFSYALIGLTEAKFGNQNSILRYVSDASYWIYLIHLPLVTLITFSMFQITLFIEIKFMIAILLTSLIGFVTYKYFVRSTVIGILLNGKKLS
jgi:glucan biosynthesis protein C